jgi:hypothetical protein
MAGRVSERASSRPRSSICSPVTSPSCQQPMIAWVTWPGSTPTFPGVLGPGAQRAGEIGQKYQLPGFPFGVAGEQLVDETAGRLGNPRMQQRGRGDDQDCAGLGFASGSWRQQQAEVAIRHPAGPQDLAEGVRAELVHCPPATFLAI